MLMPFKIRHSQRCVDADILTSAPTEITSAAVNWQTSADSWYPVLPAAVYSVLSWTYKLQYERNERCYELCRLGQKG